MPVSGPEGLPVLGRYLDIDPPIFIGLELEEKDGSCGVRSDSGECPGRMDFLSWVLMYEEELAR